MPKYVRGAIAPTPPQFLRHCMVTCCDHTGLLLFFKISLYFATKILLLYVVPVLKSQMVTQLFRSDLLLKVGAQQKSLLLLRCRYTKFFWSLHLKSQIALCTFLTCIQKTNISDKTVTKLKKVNNKQNSWFEFQIRHF